MSVMDMSRFCSLQVPHFSPMTLVTSSPTILRMAKSGTLTNSTFASPPESLITKSAMMPEESLLNCGEPMLA